MSGVKIPWSPEKRKREMSYIITIISQPSPLLWRRINLLHLYAPDDVHDMDVIRWAHAAYTSKGAYLETVPIEFIRALQGQSNKDNHRVCTGQDNEVLFDIETKQRIAAKNPIACCAAIFERTLPRTCVSICWAGRAND